MNQKPLRFSVEQTTCLKGIAIIMMLMHHCFLDSSRYKGQDVTFIIPENIWNYVSLFFKICVCIFVFISAYGITLKLKSTREKAGCDGLRAQLPSLTLSRLIRLLGGFIFVFLAIQLFALFYDPGRFAHIYGTSFPVNLEYFLLDMLGLAELFQTPTYLATFWYYSLAIVIVLAVPLLYLLLDKLGSFLFLSLAALITFTVSFQNTDIWRYILCIALAMACADQDWINRMIAADFRKRLSAPVSKTLKCLLYLLTLLLLTIVREGPLKNSLWPIFDAVIPMLLTAFCCEFVFVIPVIKDILKLIGKYSMDIFLVHNFIRVVWFYDFTYSFKYPLVIVAVLLGISLVIAMILSQVRKLIQYDRLLKKIEQGVLSKL